MARRGVVAELVTVGIKIPISHDPSGVVPARTRDASASCTERGFFCTGGGLPRLSLGRHNVGRLYRLPPQPRAHTRLLQEHLILYGQAGDEVQATFKQQ